MTRHGDVIDLSVLPEPVVRWVRALGAEGWVPGSRLDPDTAQWPGEVYLRRGECCAWWTDGAFGGNVRVRAEAGEEWAVRYVATTTTVDAAVAHAKLLLVWESEEADRARRAGWSG